VQRSPWLLAILGPTASGKTDLAEALATESGAQLINADAFQVYRGLNIGTGKSSRADLYQLLDLVEPKEEFGLGEWLNRLRPLLEELFSQGRNGILVGGTAYYVRAALEGYDALHPPPAPELRARLNKTSLPELVQELSRQAPEVAASLDLANPVRVTRALEKLESEPLPPFQIPPFQTAKWAVDRDDLPERIARRVDAMFEQGWENEVANLLKNGVNEDASGMRAIGYRDVAKLVRNEQSAAETREKVILATVQYAKRQRTWLRKEQKLVRIAESQRDDMIAKLVREGLE
jgi:tRNA dimethylallyltransferase